MKIMHKQLLLALTLMLVNTKITAKLPASLDLVNKTGKIIVVKIKLDNPRYSEFYQILSPEQTIQQTFSTTLAGAGATVRLAVSDRITDIQACLYDKALPLNGGLDLVDKTTGIIPADSQRSFGAKLYTYQFNKIETDMSFWNNMDPFAPVKKVIISDSAKKDVRGNPMFHFEVEK